MTEALFAIAGTIVGALGGILTTLVSAKHEERRAWQEIFRSVCANLTSEINRLRNITGQLRRKPDDEDLQQAAQDAHSKARGFQETLRLTSRSKATQEAARWLIHYAYHHWRATQGEPGDYRELRKELDFWLTRFYIEARKELGVSAEVYEDPEGGLPRPSPGK